MFEDKPRILIVRTDRIGDVVLSTPLPKVIKKKYPNCYVAVLLRNYTKDIYLNNPFVDEIIIADANHGSFLKLLKKIRSMSFSHSLNLLPTERMNWLLFLSGIKKRIGVGYKFYQFLTNSKSVFRNKYNPLKHESHYCLDELLKIGIQWTEDDEEIYLSEEEKNESQLFRDSICNSGEMIIGINVTSGNSAPNLRVNEYVKIILKLQKLASIKIAVTDFNPPKEILNIDGVFYPNLNKPLRKSITNFNALDLLVSSSTGSMHIAAGLKVKTLSLFCPLKACSPNLWAPKGNESHILLPEENYCKTQCPGDPKICDYSGEGGIDASIVVNKIKTLLNLSD